MKAKDIVFWRERSSDVELVRERNPLMYVINIKKLKIKFLLVSKWISVARVAQSV